MKDPRNPVTNNPYIVEMPPEYQVPQPELGPLEQRVSKTYIEAMYTDEVSIEDMNYWFTEPEGQLSPAHLFICKAEGCDLRGKAVNVHYGRLLELFMRQAHDVLEVDGKGCCNPSETICNVLQCMKLTIYEMSIFEQPG